MAHGMRCENARGADCSCSCGGILHGGRKAQPEDVLFSAYCAHCGGILVWQQVWKHLGGGRFVRYCGCGFRGSSEELDKADARCPNCGGPLRDDHPALPVYSGGRRGRRR